MSVLSLPMTGRACRKRYWIIWIPSRIAPMVSDCLWRARSSAPTGGTSMRKTETDSLSLLNCRRWKFIDISKFIDIIRFIDIGNFISELPAYPACQQHVNNFQIFGFLWISIYHFLKKSFQPCAPFFCIFLYKNCFSFVQNKRILTCPEQIQIFL